MCVEVTLEGADGERQGCNGAGRAGGATMPMQPPAVHDAEAHAARGGRRRAKRWIEAGNSWQALDTTVREF